MSVHNEHSVLVEAAADGVGDGVAHADRGDEAGTGDLPAPGMVGRHLGRDGGPIDDRSKEASVAFSTWWPSEATSSAVRDTAPTTGPTTP
ncbi:hypothetical protein [Streptomyces flaveus]|uniref:hypothetical protein n=1 Tax=Streptomyces flaveus TaxID=66370 RepID=UPI00332BF159